MIKTVSTSSLSGEGYLLKVGSFSFGSPVSASAVSKPIFEINATEDKTNFYTTTFYGSDKKIIYFGYLAASASPKISSGGFSEWLVIFPCNLSETQAKRMGCKMWKMT